VPLFNSNQHGFTKNEFERIVGDKDNVLYLIKTEEHKRTFGGYYSVRMKSVSIDNYIKDEKAFIIQLDD
jgi:hypothetical protein